MTFVGFVNIGRGVVVILDLVANPKLPVQIFLLPMSYYQTILFK